MAKRYTDTEKWKDDWYISLNNDCRIVWQWLTDNCNHAGISKRSIAALNRDCGTGFTEDSLIEAMSGRLIVVNNVWFIPKFLKFQYTTLHSKKPAILSVVREILKHGLAELIPESFGDNYRIVKEPLSNSCETIKDKVMDKDKDKKDSTYNISISNNLNIDARENFELGNPGAEADRKKFFIPQMMQVWDSHVPGYPEDEEKDFSALGEIAKFIRKREKIPDDPVSSTQAAQRIKLVWGVIAAHVANHKFFKSYSLQQVAKHIQSISQDIKNGKSGGGNRSGSGSLQDSFNRIDQMSD